MQCHRNEYHEPCRSEVIKSTTVLDLLQFQMNGLQDEENLMKSTQSCPIFYARAVFYTETLLRRFGLVLDQRWPFSR